MPAPVPPELVPPALPAASIWWLAVRPRTLTMALMPVLVGAALAWHDVAQFRPLPFLAALLGALAIQIGTNLANDASDGESGLDRPGRLGPPRVTALGLASAAQVKLAAMLAFTVAAIVGLVAIHAGGWPILGIGIASLVSGWAYSRGPWPISASPFGEVFVLLFFGIIAVCGTYWLMALHISAAAFIAGVLVGLPAAAVLLVNNHRDRAGDSINGRRTLAIMIGDAASHHLFAVLVVSAAALGPLLALVSRHAGPCLTLLAMPLAVHLIRQFYREPTGTGLNNVLARTALYQIVLGVLLICGLWLKP